MQQTTSGYEFATTSELARAGNRSEGCIRHLAREGVLPIAAVLANGTRLFDKHAALEVLARRGGPR